MGIHNIYVDESFSQMTYATIARYFYHGSKWSNSIVKLPIHCLRHASATCQTSYVQGQAPSSRIREYFYYIDHHGQLFLDDAKMKNFTSCFKDKEFLTFFFHRLKFNTTDRYSTEFPYLSLCGPERNFIRCDDLPLVFTHLVPADDLVKFKSAMEFKKKHFRTDPSVASHFLILNNADPRFCVPFYPQHLSMLPSNGRIYYPGPRFFKRHSPKRAADCDDVNNEPDSENMFQSINGSNDTPDSVNRTQSSFPPFNSVGLVSSELALRLGKSFIFPPQNAADDAATIEPEAYPVPSHFSWEAKDYLLSNEIVPSVERLHDLARPAHEVTI